MRSSSSNSTATTRLAHPLNCAVWPDSSAQGGRCRPTGQHPHVAGVQSRLVPRNGGRPHSGAPGRVEGAARGAASARIRTSRHAGRIRRRRHAAPRGRPQRGPGLRGAAAAAGGQSRRGGSGAALAAPPPCRRSSAVGTVALTTADPQSHHTDGIGVACRGSTPKSCCQDRVAYTYMHGATRHGICTRCHVLP